VIERLLILIVLSVMVGIPAGITCSKGRWVAFVLGFLLVGIIWWITACRLAHPSSWWARRFYGPDKMQQAMNRFGFEMPTAT
jgi:hypothetical protein